MTNIFICTAFALLVIGYLVVILSKATKDGEPDIDIDENKEVK